MRRLVPLALLLTLTVAGCAPVSLSDAGLPVAARPARLLDPPVALSILTEPGVGDPTLAASLTQALLTAYPGALALRADPAPLPGRVNLAIRIRQLGPAQAGAIPPRDAPPRASGTVADWATVVEAVAALGPVPPPPPAGPDDRTGVADLTLELRDRRPVRTADFALPLAAERRRAGGGDARAGRDAVSQSWAAVSPRLSSFLDATVQKLAGE